MHQNARNASSVELFVDEDKRFGAACDAAGLYLVRREPALHDPLKDQDLLIRIFQVDLWCFIDLHDLLCCGLCRLLVVEANGRGVLVARKNPVRDGLPVGGCLREGVSRFVVPSQHVV